MEKQNLPISMISQRIGRGIDSVWCALGLDFHAYAQRQPMRAQRVAIWLLALGQTIGYAGLYYVFTALLLTWEESFPWGKELLTLAFMFAIIVGAIVSPFAGRMVDRGVSRWLLSGGMALGAVTLVGLSLSTSYFTFVVCWILLGAAQGLSLYDPCFAFVTRTTGAEAGRNIARITLVAGFASTIALPAGAFLATSIGWRGAVTIFAAVVGLIGAPVLYAGGTLIECCPPKSEGAAISTRDDAAFRAARRQLTFWLLYAAFPLIGFTGGLVFVHIIPILTDAGLPLAQAVWIAALNGPMQVAGRVIMMRTAGRIRSLVMAGVSFVGIVTAILLLMAVENLPLAALGFAILFGASRGVISILRPVVTYEVLGRTAFGRISGTLAVPFLIAVAFSPQMGSWLWRVGGYALALQMAVVIASLALLVLLALGLTLPAAALMDSWSLAVAFLAQTGVRLNKP